MHLYSRRLHDIHAVPSLPNSEALFLKAYHDIHGVPSLPNSEAVLLKAYHKLGECSVSEMSSKSEMIHLAYECVKELVLEFRSSKLKANECSGTQP